MQEQRDGLEGLAEPHVVGQTTPELRVRQAGQPAVAVDLILPELRLETAGQARGRREGLLEPREVVRDVPIQLEDVKAALLSRFAQSDAARGTPDVPGEPDA